MRLEVLIMVRFLPPTPVADIVEQQDEVRCLECNRLLGEHEGAIFWGDVYRCEDCSYKVAEVLEVTAAAFAVEHCRITGKLPRFNPACEVRCTMEEYAEGFRDSYTRNSHLCECRHNYTNYEELIENLDRDNVRDQIFYGAIRMRIDALLRERIEEDGDEDDEGDADDAG
jgi:hypothetical protein